MRRASALLALAAATLAPSAAVAAPPWSVAQNLGAPHLFVDPVGVGASGDGTALAWWAWQDGIGDDARVGWSLASRPAGAAAFGPERSAPRGLFAVVAYAGTRALAGTQRDVGPPAARRSRIQVRFGRTSGAFGRAGTIADDEGLRGPRLAANSNGDAALAWFADRGTSNERVLVSLRRAGGSFGHPIRLAEGRIRSIAVAVGPRGDVLVAWDARGTMRARYRRSMGRPFAASETIRSNPTFFADVPDLAAGRGTRLVVWDNGGFEANQVFAALALPTPPILPFGAPEAVSDAQEARAGRVALAARPTVVWTNRPAGSHPPGGLGATQTFAQAATPGL
jgi:hypothetical protein